MKSPKKPKKRLEEAYAHPVKEVFSSVKSSPEGLSLKEAERRLKRYGPNILVEEKRFKSLRILASQFKNFFVVLLLLASVLSFAFESAINGAVLLGVVFLNVAISFIQENKAEKTLEALRKIHPARAEVIRGGEAVEIPVEELVVGDVVVLREGEAVPADLRMFSTRDLRIDEAVLTGESVPSDKFTKSLQEETALADRENMAYTGTLVVRGTGKGLVAQTGLETEFGRIAAFVQEQRERSLLLERIAHLSVWLVGISAALSLLVFTLGYLRNHEIIHTLNFAIALFVSAVPESLPTITTLALATTALRLSRKKALVRHLPTVEALSGINLFAFDKTGTLTRNEMTVARIVFPNRELDVAGTGFSSEGGVFFHNKKVNIDHDLQLKTFAEIGALAPTSTITPDEESDGKRWVVHGDPTEGALLILAKKVRLPPETGEALREFPFTSERRMTSAVYLRGKDLFVYSAGAPEAVLPRCQSYLQDGKAVDLSPARRVHLENQASKLAADGYRVLAFATRSQRAGAIVSRDVEDAFTFVGLAGLLDKPKDQVAETFKTLTEAGIKPVIITGDHPGTTAAVARELGLKLAAREILSGPQLDKLSDEELLDVIPRITIFARITPTQKHRLVKAFKRFGLRVAVSGDGANDAPALKKADVGVVMGEKGTDVSKEAADLVILDDKIETVLPAITEARTLYDNIRKFFAFLLSGNFDELLVIAWASIAGLPQPFTILQILWINLISDTFPAFALAYDPPSGDTLRSAPRDLGRGMIRPIIGRALLYALLDLFCDVFIILLYLPDVMKMRTVLFTQVVFFEILIVFSIRTLRPFWEELFANRYLILAFFSSALLQLLVVYAAPVHSVLGITDLNLRDWGVIFGLVGGAFVVAEIGKWIWRETHA